MDTQTSKDDRAQQQNLARADRITLIALALLSIATLTSPLYLDLISTLPDQSSDDGAIHPLLASHTGGTNPGAPVTLIEFGDYQCPYTAEQQPAISRIIIEYGDKINYVHMDLPSGTHPLARIAAAASRCISRDAPEKHNEFESLIYQNQGALSSEGLIRLARNISIDEDVLYSCMSDPSINKAIQQDIDIAAKEGVTGTPTIFIDGKPFRGAQPYAKLKLIIDSLLEIKASAGEKASRKNVTWEPAVNPK
ncbi:MAG: DsbA family protein [Nanoarchaeota archaeon]